MEDMSSDGPKPFFHDDILRMSREERHELLLECETWPDGALEDGRISQIEAWDNYFGLLHECDESGFREDRARIYGKIDTKSYNPFLSHQPEVVFLARLRAQGIGLLGNLN